MKNFETYFSIIFLLLFDMALVIGSETWPDERSKILQKFVVVNREFQSRDDEFDGFKNEMTMFKNEVIEFKSEVMELLEHYKDEIDRKQTKIDSQDQEIKTLRTKQEDMAIQGMKISNQVQEPVIHFSTYSCKLEFPFAFLNSSCKLPVKMLSNVDGKQCRC